MQKLKYYVATSLDGFIARQDGSFDFFLQEGEHVADFLSSLEEFDTVLMGRKTYEVGLAFGVTDPYPTLKSYVFSSTLRESPSKKVTVVSTDLESTVRELKDRPGKDIWLCGGADLATKLFEANLIDEVIIKLNPVLMGSGLPLFYGVDRPINLELIKNKVYDNGVIFLYYQVK